MKKILPITLSFALLFTSVIPAEAAAIPSPKEEVVYGLLNSDGSVNNLYVVNIFNGGAITDYGDYSEIHNMTTSEELKQNGDRITVSTRASKFYYKGTFKDKELPWTIGIRYFLDGREIAGTELGGKSGQLKIEVAIKQNKKVRSTFFENYALQIALSLDNQLSTNIQAANATIAQAGSKKQLTYTVLPGNSMDITVTANVHDFEMEAITLNGVKLSLGITVDRDALTGQFSELAEAIKEMDSGAAELLTGLNQLSSGMQKYIDNMGPFKDGMKQLAEGSDQVNTGAAALKDGLADLSKQNESLINGALAIRQAIFDSVNAELSQRELGLPVLTPENYRAVLSSIPGLEAVKQQLDGAVEFTQGLQGYTDGVAQLGKGASDLAAGTAQLESSAALAASSANELYTAGAELNTAIKQLRDGLASYEKGTKKLRSETSDLSSQINDKIDELLGSISGKGDQVVSFVSDKNTNISAVQFVLKTEAVKLPDTPSPIYSEPKALSFWQKLKKLFRSILGMD